MAKKPIVSVTNDSESIISMVLGAMVVIVIGALLFSYIRDWKKSKTAESTSAEESNSTPIAVQELPQSVSLEKNDAGEEVPTGLPAKYTVKAGDSTWMIAEAFYGSGFNYVDIEKANGLERDAELTVGQILTVPQVPVRTSAQAAAATEYTEKSTTAPAAVGGPSKGDDSAAKKLME